MGGPREEIVFPIEIRPISSRIKAEPLQLTVGIHHHHRGTFCDAAWQNWTILLSKVYPVKVLITGFAGAKIPATNSLPAHDKFFQYGPNTRRILYPLEPEPNYLHP